MNHLQVLDEVAARGLRLTVSGEDLRLQGPQQRMDPELVSRIRAVKAELVRHLSAPEPASTEPAGYPLTLLQRAFLIGRGNSVEIGNIASHIYHEIDGCWDIARLELALRTVVARHGALRTRFTADGRQVEEPTRWSGSGFLTCAVNRRPVGGKRWPCCASNAHTASCPVTARACWPSTSRCCRRTGCGCTSATTAW